MFKPSEIYHNSSKRQLVHKLLMNNALQMLNKAKIVANIETALILAKVSQKFLQSTNPSENEDGLQLFIALMNCYEHIIDETVIVSAFENFAKSKLLKKMYIVHEFDSSQDDDVQKKIKSRQKKFPIHIKTYLAAHDRQLTYIFRDTTLLVSILLSQKYVKLYGLSTPCIEQLKLLNRTRNVLHMNTSITSSINLQKIEAIYELKNAIEKHI
ncbi:MAG: hypothetical protein EOO52_11805 [Gammaproteobacteria bacterium]|nr:MAG: hypothetical protein EOO52_11805 [Gammaproteobacteria bacterium]